MGSATRTLTQDELNITDKTRSNLFPWRGQFSPQLVEALLSAYAPSQGRVADPFVGSGTVLHEAGTIGLRAFGSEINPAAFTMARIYRFMNLEIADRVNFVRRMDRALAELLPQQLPLFRAANEAGGPIPDSRRALVGLWSEMGEAKCSELLEALIVLLDFYRNEITPGRICSAWGQLRALVMDLPFSSQPVEVCLSDARQLPLEPGTVDLVITSPPYINVFNYHQKYRASVEAIGWRPLHVAHAEIGANRKHRQNRFLTVVQYCMDMHQVIEELLRVCSSQGRIILVVGRESNVMRTAFYNGEIVRRIASACSGLELREAQERVYRNKFGKPIYEDILHFAPGRRCVLRASSTPLDVARRVLCEAQPRVPEEARADLATAVELAHRVKCSPFFNPSRARRQGACNGKR